MERHAARPDIVDAIGQLNAQQGKDLIRYGTSRLDAALLQAGLVDELRLWIMPVVVGTGQRLFEDIDTSMLHLTLAMKTFRGIKAGPRLGPAAAV